MFGSAECGVMGVKGEGVAGPIDGVTAAPLEPPKFTIGDIIECCLKKSSIKFKYNFYRILRNK